MAFLSKGRMYSIYVLSVLLLAYLVNQLHRFLLATMSKPMAHDIHFGDKACMANYSLHLENISCKAQTADACASLKSSGISACVWDYNGQGFDYQILAGPVFVLVYTICGIFLGFAADVYNRKILMSICIIFWSLMTLLTGFVLEYWQLVILRFGLGSGEAGCTPFAASLIAQYFDDSLRGLAMSTYNWGIYLGYGMSYFVGNYATRSNLIGEGWRTAFKFSAIPGFIVGLLVLLTVKEPCRDKPQINETEGSEVPTIKFKSSKKLPQILKAFVKPSMILLCIGGSVRNAAGYVWAYNTQPYFIAVGESKSVIGLYMLLIPVTSGTVGVLLGGFLADRVVKKSGVYARVLILVISQLLASPFAVLTLYMKPPQAFYFQIPTYIIGEMWVGVALTVLVELVPTAIRTSAVAVYLFIITNIGGNVPLLVPVFQHLFENKGLGHEAALRGSLYVLYPGLYAGAAVFFLLTTLVVKRDQEQVIQHEGYEPINSDTSKTE